MLAWVLAFVVYATEIGTTVFRAMTFNVVSWHTLSQGVAAPALPAPTRVLAGPVHARGAQAAAPLPAVCLAFNHGISEGQVGGAEAFSSVVESCPALGVDAASSEGAGAHLVAGTDAACGVRVTLTTRVALADKTSNCVLALRIVSARVTDTFIYITNTFSFWTAIIVVRTLALCLSAHHSTLGINTTKASFAWIDAFSVGTSLSVAAVLVSCTFRFSAFDSGNALIICRTQTHSSVV